MSFCLSLDDLKAALSEDALLFYYQPKISFITGRISGGEALIRWRKQDGAMIPPSAFIPLAERSGFITQITQHMFSKLVADYQVIQTAAAESHVAFNVSGSDLEREELVKTIELAIDQGSIRSHSLRLEVTEATALSSSQQMRDWAQRLVSRGVELAMDDFGTGYATLEAIRRLPFSTLKVDQGIVREMLSSERAASLVHANVSLAQVLGMETVAEGIETEAIYNALLHSGCREGQGYWMSRPLPLSEYLTLLKANRAWPASHSGLLRAELMSHIISLRRVMDWVYSAKFGGSGSPGTELARAWAQRPDAFFAWFEGEGSALKGNPTFEAMRLPYSMLWETYDVVCQRAQAGAGPSELSGPLTKLAHYTVVLIGDLLRLESELLLSDLGGAVSTHV